jgi:hypothetical protein
MAAIDVGEYEPERAAVNDAPEAQGAPWRRQFRNFAFPFISIRNVGRS